MSINNWGPATWNLLHTLSYKIKEEHFEMQKEKLIYFLTNICNNLPCPDCTKHARLFLQKINIKNIKTKNDYILVVFTLHNEVNIRLKKAKQEYDIVHSYDNYKLRNIIINFINKFQVKGNMKMLSNTFHRTQLLNEFMEWVKKNISYFNE
jgi:hypothetical protein